MWRLVLALCLGATWASSDVTYIESYGSSQAGRDWVPYTMHGSGTDAFDDATYAPSSFDPTNTVQYTVYIKGLKLARIGQMSATIYDLQAGTVTQVDPLNRSYFVLGFSEMERTLKRKFRKVQFGIDETGDSVQLSAQEGNAYSVVLFAADDKQHILAHGVIWTIPKLPSDVARYRKFCLDRYGKEYPDLCSIAEPKGLEMLAEPTSGLSGFPIVEILERRMLVPSGTPFDDIPKPATAGGYAADIVRTESRLDDFKEGPVDDSYFNVPHGYKLKKSALKSLKR